MILRRVAAYFIDLTLYLLLILGSLWLVDGIANGFLRGFVAFIILLVVTFVVYGFLSVLLRGSIGKKIMDLKVLPTYGLITPVRLYMRDGLVKYGVWVPVGVGIYLLTKNRIEYGDMFRVLLIATLVLLVVLLIGNLITYSVNRTVLLDRLFFTKIENDIPTAQEYQDLQSFISEKK